MEIHIKERFIEARTIYGCVEKLKLYLYNTIYVVQKYEDSGVTIKNNTLANIYIYIYIYVSRRNQNISMNLRQITMYGTCFEKKSKHTRNC